MKWQKHAHPAVEHAQNFAKICIIDARICCNFFTISARGALNFASALRGFRFESRTTSAQLQCKSVPCGVPKKPRVRRLRILFSTRKLANSFNGNSPRGRHALHRNFGRRRCENILTLKNFCIDLLTWCAPKKRRLNRAFGATIEQFSHRKRANSLQNFCAVDVQRTRISAGVAAKTF